MRHRIEGRGFVNHPGIVNPRASIRPPLRCGLLSMLSWCGHGPTYLTVVSTLSYHHVRRFGLAVRRPGQYPFG